MMHERPIFDEKLVKRFEYDIDVIRYIDGQPNKTLDKLVIHPIEVGNRLEFKSKEDAGASLYIPIEDITEVSTPEQTDVMPEKKDLLLEIEFKDSQSNKKSIAFNVQDRHIEATLVKTLKPMEQNYWDTVELEYILDGMPKTTQLYYKTPFLSDGEELLWLNTRIEGIVNKHLRWIEALTNFRAIYYDFEKHDSGRIPLSLVDDVIVRNQRTASESNKVGTFTANTNNFTVTETTSNDNRIVGDVIFVRIGNPIVTFMQVSDPYRLARLAKAVISQLFSSVKSNKTQLPMAEEQIMKVKTSAAGEPICSYCGTVNQIGSKFCSTCGFALK